MQLEAGISGRCRFGPSCENSDQNELLFDKAGILANDTTLNELRRHPAIKKLRRKSLSKKLHRPQL